VPTKYRHDIQGLRAVAVLLVVLEHAGVGRARGGYVGVDVFFVVSGFLITGILLAEAERRGSVSLTDFYVRRARRILPAAALTLLATDLAARHLLNFVRAREVIADSAWAAACGANVHFARIGSDYFASAQPPSPLLHFWTLSVEEQFYLAWPTVVLLVLFGALFRRRTARRKLLTVTVALGLASFVWSVESTRSADGAAYFSTFARAWELALGAALAVALPRAARIRPAVALALGWAGLAAVAAAAVTYSAATPFPGYAAALPAVGTALVIFAGARSAPSAPSVARLLSAAPLRYVGDRSYALYLWHWPVLTIAYLRVGHELGPEVKLLLLAGAFVLSILSYALVEDPIRRARLPRRSSGLLAAASAAVVVVVAAAGVRLLAPAAGTDVAAAAVRPLFDPVTAQEQARPAAKPLPAVVAAVRAAERGDALPSALTPPVERLHDDFYFFPDGCTPSRYGTSSKICRLGRTSSGKTIVVFGDSHAEMWMPAILAMAQRDGWAVIPLVKVRCVPRTWPGTDDCAAWYRWAKRQARALRPQVTMIVGSRSGTYDPLDAIDPVASLANAMKSVSASVIVVGDEPNQKRDPSIASSPLGRR
jgi:peptidoglycan/LPS O-acetylase OafA/YrhL